jgi:hypothetical protein
MDVIPYGDVILRNKHSEKSFRTAIKRRYNVAFLMDGVYIRCNFPNIYNFQLNALTSEFKQLIFVKFITAGHIEFIPDLAMVNRSWYDIYRRMLPDLYLAFRASGGIKGASCSKKTFSGINDHQNVDGFELRERGFSSPQNLPFDTIRRLPHEILFSKGFRYFRAGFVIRTDRTHVVTGLTLPVDIPKYPDFSSVSWGNTWSFTTSRFPMRNCDMIAHWTYDSPNIGMVKRYPIGFASFSVDPVCSPAWNALKNVRNTGNSRHERGFRKHQHRASQLMMRAQMRNQKNRR